MNRRKMLKVLGVSPALVAGFPAGAKAAHAEAPGVDASSGGPITVMNPGIANKLATRVPLAPPIDTLQGKTIYMINLSWEGPDAANYFYGAMREWLDQHYSGVKTIVRVTADGMFGTDAGIMKEIVSSKADAAIVGVAG
jgi:hypothetical protein